MAAFSASRLVCSAIPVIVSTIPPICSDFDASFSIAPATDSDESRTERIASVAYSAARTPSRATTRVSSAACAVSCADAADCWTATETSSVASRADCTTRT
jgi:hypothetical protein